jgi:hypothetical protein
MGTCVSLSSIELEVARDSDSSKDGGGDRVRVVWMVARDGLASILTVTSKGS